MLPLKSPCHVSSLAPITHPLLPPPCLQAGANRGGEWQRAKRFKKLNRMLNSPKAQQMMGVLKRWARLLLILLGFCHAACCVLAGLLPSSPPPPLLLLRHPAAP